MTQMIKRSQEHMSLNIAQQERDKLRDRLALRKEDPNFRQDVKRLRQSISNGANMNDARENLSIDDDRYWQDMVFCVAALMMSPETVMLEWQIRHNARYQMAMDLYVRSSKDNEYGDMGRAIALLCKMDADDMEMKRALGLVKPLKVGEEAEGISSEDIELVKQRYQSQLDERILRKMELRQRARPPVPLSALIESESGRQAHGVGETALVDINPRRPIAGDNIPESQSNGREHVLNPVDNLVVQESDNT